MARTNIQVPVTTSLKQKAVARAEELGFSSIQDVIRVFLTNFTEKKLNVEFKEPEMIEYISEEQYRRLEKDFKELKEAYKKGEAYEVNSLDEMMAVLNSDKID